MLIEKHMINYIEFTDENFTENRNRVIELCKEIKRRNIVQLGGELAHLVIRDPDYIGKVTKDILYEVGREVKLKKNVLELIKILKKGM